MATITHTQRLTWHQLVDGDLMATKDGRTVFSIEKRRGGYGLRRWSTRLDGSAVMGGVEIVKSISAAKAYAAKLSR